jgi:hypothetical protein
MMISYLNTIICLREYVLDQLTSIIAKLAYLVNSSEGEGAEQALGQETRMLPGSLHRDDHGLYPDYVPADLVMVLSNSLLQINVLSGIIARFTHPTAPVAATRI